MLVVTYKGVLWLLEDLLIVLEEGQGIVFESTTSLLFSLNEA